MKKLVTKEFIKTKLEENAEKLIGRALSAILKYQTDVESTNNITKDFNGVGFTKSDSRTGTLTAKYYLKHGKLEEWQLKLWKGLNKKGEPRILKYADQLNRIANGTN